MDGTQLVTEIVLAIAASICLQIHAEKSHSHALTHILTHMQYFTVKMSDGIVATSYGTGHKFYIDPFRLLPMERFLPKPKGAPSPGGRGEPCKGGTIGFDQLVASRALR
jgi:hypothetical protein